eukprot:CAMPEP_0115011756 /NCGR_PEP_ID=MMETSP0216-20121206/24262_1 /TAXON_ID=223996 /ORGANISM="Protocruzia adherens, Strain Boccale" /LENGTH=336 /DNA_ID=CAMNT_0002380545 /DNA_START=71 /DNA_END=1081 /DNA_ORIENTATION=-
MSGKTAIFIVTILALVSAVHSSKCHVLALEGGGSNGAFQAGALHELIYSLPKEDTPFQAVSGISTGTLNSIGFATHPIGNETAVADFIYDLWSTVTQSDVWTSWDLGVTEGFLDKGGIYNSAALGKFLEEMVPSNHTERSVYMGTDDLNTGAFVINYNKALDREDYLYAARSSAAAPFFFPPISWQSPIGPQTDTDGGTKMNLNLLSAIRHCLLEGYDESDIVVDAAMCFTPGAVPTFNPSTQTTLDMLGYVKNMWLYNFANYYIAEVMHAYPLANFRYLLYPLKAIPSKNPIAPLNFDHDHLKGLLAQGESDASEIISWGPGVSWKQFIKGSTSA